MTPRVKLAEQVSERPLGQKIFRACINSSAAFMKSDKAKQLWDQQHRVAVLRRGPVITLDGERTHSILGTPDEDRSSPGRTCLRHRSCCCSWTLPKSYSDRTRNVTHRAMSSEHGGLRKWVVGLSSCVFRVNHDCKLNITEKQLFGEFLDKVLCRGKRDPVWGTRRNQHWQTAFKWDRQSTNKNVS